MFLCYGYHRDLYVLTPALPPRRASDLSAGAALVEQHDAVLRRVVEAPHLRAAAAARTAVQQHHRLAPGIAALLVMERVAVVDFELAGVEGFDLGIERAHAGNPWRSEEHTSALQSIMRISYADFCLKKKKQ